MRSATPRRFDNNGLDGSQIIDPDDRELADLLVPAAAGRTVEAEILRFFRETTADLGFSSRRQTARTYRCGEVLLRTTERALERATQP